MAGGLRASRLSVRFLTPWTDRLYAVFRIVTGLLFAVHGSQKLFGFPGDRDPAELMTLRGLAGVIEFFGGLAVAAGWQTSIAAFIASGTMAVAYFLSHAERGFFPHVNRGELAVLYCFIFLYIAARGSGPWSLDAKRRKYRPG